MRRLTWISSHSSTSSATNCRFIPFAREVYESALQRRQLRLILAGKMKPADAKELRALFEVATELIEAKGIVEDKKKA